MSKTTLPLLMSVLAVAGCSYTPTKDAIDATHASLAVDVARSNASIVQTAAKPLVRHVPGSWFGVRAKPLGEDATLPAVFKAPITLKFPGHADLRTIAERLTKVTGVPVSLKPDVFLPLSAFFSNGQSNSAGQDKPEVRPGSAPIGLASMETMELNFVNVPLLDVINQINSRFGIHYTYREGEGIVFSRMVTRTLVVASPTGDTGLNTSLGKSGGGGGSAGGGGSGQAQNQNAAGDFSSSGTVTMNSSFSTWANLEKVIDTLKTAPGRYFVNQATGTVTINDMKEVVETVARYVEQQNAITTTGIAVKVELWTVSSTDKNELGVNWNAIYTKLNNLNPQWALNIVTPPSLAGTAAGLVGVSILTPAKDAASHTLAKLSGSDAMFNALQGYAKVTTREGYSGLTLNRQPTTLAKTTQMSYLARTVASSGGGLGGSTLPGLEPGQLTTGFLSQVIPTIQDDGTVVLQFGIDSSVLLSQNKEASGSGATYQAITTNNVGALQTLQRVVLRSGSTLVLTGYEREQSQYNQQGLGQNIGLGGSRTSNTARESTVILITPVILDGKK